MLELALHTAKMVELMALLVMFGFAFWPVAQAYGLEEAVVPKEVSCVQHKAWRYRC